MKVGDKVRVVAEEVYYSTPVGLVGTLVHYRSDNPYGCTVMFEHSITNYIFQESELKVVEE